MKVNYKMLKTQASQSCAIINFKILHVLCQKICDGQCTNRTSSLVMVFCNEKSLFCENECFLNFLLKGVNI